MQDNETQDNDLDWQKMSDLWQQDGLSETIDLKRLSKALKRKAFQMKLMLALEWLVSIMGVVMGILILLKYDSLFENLLGIFTILASLFMGWFGYKNRRNTWQAKDHTVQAMVDLSLKRANAAINYAKMNLYVAPFGLLFVLFAYDHRSKDFASMPADKVANLQTLFIVALIFIFVAVVWSIWYWVKNKKRRIYWQEVKSQLTE